MNLKGVLVEDQQKDTLLYAGTVQVNITDWFFLKDHADLHYIGLQDAVIKLQRTDSTWNYHFLEQYFSSSETSTQKKAGIEFNLKKVLMKNVSILQRDAWVGNDLNIKLGSLDLDANNISISGKVVDANSLKLVDPYFHQYSYTGRKPKSTIIVEQNGKEIIKDTALQWNPDNWNVILNKLSINNGTYRNDRETLVSNTTYFDGQHIHFSAINGAISNFRWLADTLKANIDITTNERSGLQVKQLKSNILFHPQIMEFNNLYLKTNRSELGNYFAMRYEDIGDMNDFLHAVNMAAHFKKTIVSSDDIAFFAPQIKDWNKTFYIDGNVKGTVDALTGTNTNIRVGHSTALQGNFSLVGLPNINETLINVEARELRTNYADAVRFIPAIRNVTTPNLRKLGALRFTGTFTGFYNDFVTYGTIQTSLGTVRTDLNMKLPDKGQPTYSGTISTESFQLGQFINNNDFGTIAFNGKVKGSSFEWKKLDLNIDGTVRKLHFQDYTYQNITAKGRLQNRKFEGVFAINDPNARAKMNGIIDLSKDIPLFNLTADVEHLHLKALRLSKEELILGGKFDLNISSKDIASILGNASIRDASLTLNGNRLSFDSLVVSSFITNGIRTLSVKSNELDASVTGQFDFKSLPEAFTLFLSRYYPAYIRPARYSIPNQNFTFNITTGVVEDYIKLLDNRLSGFNNSQIDGSLNVATSSLTLEANIPEFSFQQYNFSDVKLNGDGNFDRLIINGEVNNAIIGDSLYLPQTTFTIQANNDISDIVINTTANQTINKADISARVRTYSNGVSIEFNPSSFVLNGKTWNIEQGGELDFRSNSVVQGALILRESNQEVRLTTQPSGIGNWNDLHIALTNINMGDFAPFFLKEPRIEGLLTGEVVIEDPQERLNIIGSIRTDQLRVDNDSIGQVKGDIRYNNRTGLLTANGANTDPEHKIQFDLALDFKDSANLHQDRITVTPVNYPVKILERFIGGLFSDLQGFLTGKLDIIGEGRNQNFIGKARLKDAGLKVNFTQVFYKIDDTDIELKANEINFGTMKLRDKDGKTATVRGSIGHSGFQNMVFDLEATVDNDPIELINTTYNDNQDFYGRAKGTGTLVLAGPQHDMNMYIELNPSNRDSSYITLPPSRTRESGQASFMVERKYGREMSGDELTGSQTNITYAVNLTANPWVTVEVVLDELTGDVIKGRGNGDLYIRAGTSEPMSIRGRYEIEEGSYLFTFQSFFKKPFELRKGGTNYIEWTGDPYSAQIRFDALYQAKNVSFTPLATSLSLDQNLNRYRGDVNVIAQLSGELFRPTFNFKIEFPENSIANSSPSLAFGIQQIERNPNEINKQVTYLIVFNSFAPFESGQASYNPLNEFAYSTISGLFFGEVNKRLNQLLSRILRNNDLTFNFTGSLYNRNLINQNARGFNINQATAGVSVGLPLLNDRIQITFGGTFDVPLGSDIEQKIRLFPDVNVDLLINKSGSVRATFFYSQIPDLTLGTARASGLNQRAGAKMSYRKEFTSLKEFFFGKKQTGEKNNPDSANQNRVDSTTSGSQ